MKKRGLLPILILSVVTLGIYDIYWLIKVKKVLNQTTSIKVPTIWMIVAPYLLLILAAIMMTVTASHNVTTSSTAFDSYSGYNTPATTTSSTNPVFGLLFFVILIAIIPVTFLWTLKFSKALHQYTKGELNTPVSFMLLWSMQFMGIALIQDKFNDMIDAGTAAGFTAAPALAAPVVPQPPVAPTAPQV